MLIAIGFQNLLCKVSYALYESLVQNLALNMLLYNRQPLWSFCHTYHCQVHITDAVILSKHKMHCYTSHSKVSTTLGKLLKGPLPLRLPTWKNDMSYHL